MKKRAAIIKLVCEGECSFFKPAKSEDLACQGFLFFNGHLPLGRIREAGAILSNTPLNLPPAQEPEETRKNTTATQEIPKKTFGKTGEQVPILSFGGIFDTRQNQLLLNQAVKMGVTYWDTAEGYINGASEEGMGQYFEKYIAFPEILWISN